MFYFPCRRLNAHNRVRSLGNLADLSQLEQEQQEQHMPPDGTGNQGNNYQNEAPTTPLHRSHTITERPQSMYASQQQMNGPTRVSMYTGTFHNIIFESIITGRNEVGPR